VCRWVLKFKAVVSCTASSTGRPRARSITAWRCAPPSSPAASASACRAPVRSPPGGARHHPHRPPPRLRVARPLDHRLALRGQHRRRFAGVVVEEPAGGLGPGPAAAGLRDGSARLGEPIGGYLFQAATPARVSEVEGLELILRPEAVRVGIIVNRSGMRWHPGMEYRETRSYQRILYIFKRPHAGTVLRDQQLWMLLRAGHRSPKPRGTHAPLSLGRQPAFGLTLNAP